MSVHYSTATATDPNKIASRLKIAHAIRNTGKHAKVIHHLGGVSPEIPFESCFPALRTTFVRYEKLPCETPKFYTQAEWVRDEDGIGLKEKQMNQIGYFCNGDFFSNVEDFVNIFEDKKNYFWIDYCGMPKEQDMDNIKNTFFNPEMECLEELYITFYLNARGEQFPSLMMNRYGTSLEDRARSVCDSMRDILKLDTFQLSVFDSYVNLKGSPMAVIKISRTTTTK